MAKDADVEASAEGEEVVGEVGLVVREVEDATAYEGFGVGGKAAIGAAVAGADFVGALVDLLAVGAVELVEFELGTEMAGEVEISVGEEALDAVIVVGVGGDDASADLEFAQPGGGGAGLGVKAGWSEQNEGCQERDETVQHGSDSLPYCWAAGGVATGAGAGDGAVVLVAGGAVVSVGVGAPVGRIAGVAGAR